VGNGGIRAAVRPAVRRPSCILQVGVVPKIPKPPAPFAAPLLGVPAALCVLPTWALLALLGVTATLIAAQVVVTQIIRLRASARITRSQDALCALHGRFVRPSCLTPGRGGQIQPVEAFDSTSSVNNSEGFFQL
jgi:hypothetical protein